MANAILNFHFDFPHTSLICTHYPSSYVLCNRTQPENLQHTITQCLTVCAQHLNLEPFLLLSQDFSFLHLHVVRAKVLDNYSKETIFVVSKSYNFDFSNWFIKRLLSSRHKYFRDNQKNFLRGGIGWLPMGIGSAMTRTPEIPQAEPTSFPTMVIGLRSP